MTRKIFRGLIFLFTLLFAISTVNAIDGDDDLLAHWKLDNLSDSSGNGHTLTNVGATLTSTGCHDGDCYDFDGLNDYLQAVGFNYDDNDMTLSLWAERDTSQTGDMLNKYSGGGYAMLHVNTDILRFYSGTLQLINTVPTYSNNVLRHYVLAYNSSANGLYIYVDGQYVTSAGRSFTSTANDWFIGQSSTGGNFFDGTIDEVSIWNRSLDSSEISDLYNNGISYPSSPMSLLPLTVNLTSPVNQTEFAYYVTGFNLNVSTNETAVCEYDSINFTSTNSTSHSTLYSMGTPNWQNDTYSIEVYCSNANKEGYMNVEFYRQSNPDNITINVNSPADLFNYTYDVMNVSVNIDTNVNASCYYTYNATNTNLTTVTNQNHLETFNLGVPVNDTLTYNVDFTCTQLNNPLNNSVTESIEFYKQREPLDFQIVVPEDEQIYSKSTSELTFYIVTNYVSECSFNSTLNPLYTVMDNTESSVHTHVFAIDTDILLYRTGFSCYASYVNETTNKTVTFYIEEELSNLDGLNVIIEDTFGVLETTVDGTTDTVIDLTPLAIIGGAIVFMVSMLGLIFAFIRIMLTRSTKRK